MGPAKLAAFKFGLAIIFLAGQVNSQCNPSPCGVNTRCEVSGGGAAVCRCLEGYNHQPGQSTIDGCPLRKTAQKTPFQPQRPASIQIPNRRNPDNAIVISANSFDDPCSGNPCGLNARCRAVRSRAVCSCEPGATGDPYTNCVVDPCKSDPCGINAICESTGSRAICKCARGATGDPFVRCNDDPCSADPCGANAVCESSGSRAICKCSANYEGDPFVECRLNPCLANPCGNNAKCERNGNRAICKCLEGYEGDPFVSCTLQPCYNDPCGVNAECSSRGRSAVCSCVKGYVGDPYTSCQIEPCQSDPCGINAECESRGRSAICRCPRDHTGDPYTRCTRNPCASDPCGANALCESRGSSAICKCPPNHVGDPYVSCTFDPCQEGPCGPNAECSLSGARSLCRCVRGYTGSPYDRSSGCRADPCSSGDFCGANAECRNENLRPVCYCLPGHKGDPYTGCVQGECVSNSECPTTRACQDFRCVDPCSTSCGTGADCEVRNHVAICRCPRGRTGDPFQSCRKFTQEEICKPCGENTDCEVGRDNRPKCSCKRDYIGNPLTGCRRECTTDRECADNRRCSQFKCVAVCAQGACGESANCEARNNRAICTCPTNFLGDPYSRCYAECQRHTDCQQSQACVALKCVDPCFIPESPCGQGADCNVRNHKPICSCPRGYTGDPFVSCRQFTRQDLCSPNPCGAGANCQPGTDRSGGDRPVCTCPRGSRGDPLISCQRGECDNDGDCGNTMACINFSCVNPCRDGCGVNANCKAVNHGAVCSCPAGHVGDPLTACRATRNPGGNNRKVIGISSRFKRQLFSYDPDQE